MYENDDMKNCSGKKPLYEFPNKYTYVKCEILLAVSL
jgi:hypothetical protein